MLVIIFSAFLSWSIVEGEKFQYFLDVKDKMKLDWSYADFSVGSKIQCASLCNRDKSQCSYFGFKEGNCFLMETLDEGQCMEDECSDPGMKIYKVSGPPVTTSIPTTLSDKTTTRKDITTSVQTTTDIPSTTTTIGTTTGKPITTTSLTTTTRDSDTTTTESDTTTTTESGTMKTTTESDTTTTTESGTMKTTTESDTTTTTESGSTKTTTTKSDTTTTTESGTTTTTESDTTKFIVQTTTTETPVTTTQDQETTTTSDATEPDTTTTGDPEITSTTTTQEVTTTTTAGPLVCPTPEPELQCLMDSLLLNGLGSRSPFFGDALSPKCYDFKEKMYDENGEKIHTFFPADGGLTVNAKCETDEEVIVRFKLCVMDAHIAYITIHCFPILDTSRIDGVFNASSKPNKDVLVNCDDKTGLQKVFFMPGDHEPITRVIFQCFLFKVPDNEVAQAAGDTPAG